VHAFVALKITLNTSQEEYLDAIVTSGFNVIVSDKTSPISDRYDFRVSGGFIHDVLLTYRRYQAKR